MFYKITNTDSEVYKKLHEMRLREREMEKENHATIEEKSGLKFDASMIYGHAQQNFRRVTQYASFKFEETEKIDPKVWVADKQYPEFFKPNKRTKAGREMYQLVQNGLKGGRYDTPLEILGVNDTVYGRFALPYVDIAENGNIIIYIDDKDEPKDENVIEITKKEFNQILNNE